MPSISQEEKRKAEEFTSAINELLEFVESVVPYVDDNEYLKQMNNLKTINDNRSIIQITQQLTERVRNNEIVREADTRSRMTIAKRKALTTAQKLESGMYCICSRCDRIIRNNYLSQHQQLDICKNITTTKNLTYGFKKQHTEREMLLINKIRGWGAKTHRGCFYK
jgi:predicted PP-loop superfamily ATPase